jgi:hypothetical protein
MQIVLDKLGFGTFRKHELANTIFQVVAERSSFVVFFWMGHDCVLLFLVCSSRQQTNARFSYCCCYFKPFQIVFVCFLFSSTEQDMGNSPSRKKVKKTQNAPTVSGLGWVAAGGSGWVAARDPRWIKDEDFPELYESYGLQQDHISYSPDGKMTVNLLVDPDFKESIQAHLIYKFGSLDNFIISVGTITCVEE